MRPFLIVSRKQPILAGLLMFGISTWSFGSGDEDFSGAHQRMMESIHHDVARNHRVLGRPALSLEVSGAMARVQRHLFVPHELWGNAYANRPLPIGHGQTISQPTIVAMMTDLLALGAADTVMEIGTGSGYQAAVLAEVVESGKVHTIEIVPELARSARDRLDRMGYDNIEIHEGDGYLGLPEQGPFAGIIVTAAAPEIPEPLIDQLAPGGRLVMPVGPHGDTQWLTTLDKDAEGKVSRSVVLAVRFVPLVRSTPDDE
jgi:protein-L-isoaspartate(D-aspartate) O-methyltransferase